jgi:Mis12 protein
LGFAHSSDPTTIPDTDADGNIEYPEARLEIENGLHQLETLFEATVDKAFDKLEIYVLRNILTVPEDLLGWVRLGHYEVGNQLFLDCSFRSHLSWRRRRLPRECATVVPGPKGR